MVTVYNVRRAFTMMKDVLNADEVGPRNADTAVDILPRTMSDMTLRTVLRRTIGRRLVAGPLGLLGF